MTRTDPDIAAVRHLPPGLPEPTDEAVSRTWYAISARRAMRGRSRSRIRFLVPVTAAVLVAGLAVGSAVVFAPGDGGKPPIQAGRGGNPPTSPEAAAVLDRPIDVRVAMDRLIAAGASATPMPLRAGQLIYVHTAEILAASSAAGQAGQTQPPPKTRGTGQSAPASKSIGGGQPGAPQPGGAATSTALAPEDHHMWLDPQGMIALGIVRNGEDMTKGPKADHEAQVAEARHRLAADGPSLAQPTPQWLAALPTDPAELRARLVAAIGENKWSEEHRLVSALGDLFWMAEPVLTPEVRVALYRVLAGIDGLTAAEVSIDGRKLYAVRHTERQSADDLLFDPITGRAVGRGSAVVDDSRAGPARPGGPWTYRALWTYAIVSAVGRTQ
jgi:hypothetical protein